MAEPPAKRSVQDGIRPHGPSRLRNQVLPDSADDDGIPNLNDVQVPNSDFCIEDTPCGPGQTELEGVVHESDDPMSPNSRALLERNRVSKHRSAERVVMLPTFLFRKAIDDVDQHAPKLPFTFQPFKQMISTPDTKPSSKVPSIADNVEDQRAALTSEKAHVIAEEQTSRSSQQSRHHAERKQARRPERCIIEDDDQAGKQLQTESVFIHTSQEQTKMLERNNTLPTATRDEDHSEFDSATGSTPDIKQSKPSHKRSKKTRKGQQYKLPNSTVAPKKQRAESQVLPTARVQKGILNVITTTDGEPVFGAVTDTASALIVEPSAPFDQDRRRAKVLDDRALHATVEKRSPPKAVREELVAHDGYQDAILEPEVSMRKLTDERSAATEASEVADTILHATSSEGGPNRVNKTHKPGRTGGIARGRGDRAHLPKSRDPLDGLLNGIRFSFAAEQVKNEHNQNTIVQAHNDTVQALRDTNVQYQCRVEALEESQRELRMAMKQKSDVAKKLQKYVQGLSNDHIRFKATVKSQEESYKKILYEKIQEIESERSSLTNQFNDTIAHLERGQRKLRAVADECYSELQIVIARKADLVKTVSDQRILLERERQKSADLEGQIVDSLQTFLRRLETDHETLIGKLESIQTSADSSNASGTHSDPVRECLEELRKLRTIPSLTINDVQKAEGMLRYVHQSIDSKLESLTRSVDISRTSPEAVEHTVIEQLQILKSEVLQYNQTKADYVEACRSNERLIHELQVQREQCERLAEQLQELQLSEENLKAKTAQLELELRAVKDNSLNSESESSGLESEMDGLRVELQKAKHDLRDAAASVKSSDRLRLEQESVALQMKQRAEEAESMLAKCSKTSKHEEIERRVQFLSKEIEKGLQKKSQEKEAALANNLHRATRERDEKEQSMQAIVRELEATNNVLHQVREKLRIAESEIKVLQKHKAESESRLHNAKRSPREVDAITSEIDSLEEKLNIKTAAYDTKEAELVAAQQQQTETQNRLQALQDLFESTKRKLTEEHTAMESLRHQSDLRRLEQERNHNTAIQEANNQVSNLKGQVRKLESSFEQERRTIESQLSELLSKYQLKKEDMERQLSQARATQSLKESELARVREESEGQLKEEEAKHHIDLEDLQRRLAQSDTALKESEAKVKRIQHELQEALAVRKDLTAKNNADLRRAQETAAMSREHGSRAEVIQESTQDHTPHAPKSSSVSATPSAVPQNIHVAKIRTKVNRQDNSILSIGHPVPVNTSPQGIPPPASSEADEHLNDPSDSLGPKTSTDWLGALEHLDENGVSLVNRAPDHVPETQEQPEVTLGFAEFNKRLSQVTKDSHRSSSELSPADSNLIYQVESQNTTTPTRIDHGAVSDVNMTTPNRPEHTIHNIQNHERLESRANSAARMAPPSGSFSHRKRRKLSVSHELIAPQSKGDPTPGEMGKNSHEGSSPDFAHPHSITAFGQHARPSSSSPGVRAHNHHAPESKSKNKRKYISSSAKRASTSKTVRESSASLPSSLVVGNQRQRERKLSDPIPSNASSQQKKPSRSSAIVIRSRSVRGSSSQVSARGSSSRSSRRASSQTNNMQDRFSQELP